MTSAALAVPAMSEHAGENRAEPEQGAPFGVGDVGAVGTELAEDPGQSACVPQKNRFG
jgi:hypothetical protein